MVKGIGESMKGEWSGDIDLSDGKLNLLHHDYRRLLEETSHVGLDNRRSSPLIAADIRAASERLKDYLSFIHGGDHTHVHIPCVHL